MFLGDIVEIGSRAALIQDPQHPQTRELIHAVAGARPAGSATSRRRGRSASTPRAIPGAASTTDLPAGGCQRVSRA